MMSLTFGLFTQVSGSGLLGPLVFFYLERRGIVIAMASAAAPWASCENFDIF